MGSNKPPQQHSRAPGRFFAKGVLIPLAMMQAAPCMAQSHWSYDPAPAMATAFCVARAAGKTMEQSTAAANTAAAAAFQGGIGALLGSRAQLKELGQRAIYLTVKMCPELISQ